jgi:hypothetical protein
VYFVEPLTDSFTLQEIAVKATPLVMIAVGLSLCYIANIWNIGAEGCLDARHARAVLRMQLNKTDRNDAEGLAQIMRTGWYRAVHVKSFDAQRARALLGARLQLARAPAGDSCP